VTAVVVSPVLVRIFVPVLGGLLAVAVAVAVAVAESRAEARAEARAEVPSSLLAALPEGEPPEKGWPVMILLHGYGTAKEDFRDVIDLVSRHSVAAYALDAPTAIGDGRRSWGRASAAAATHEYLQGAIASLRDDPRLDWTVIHVGGFSQGAIHAVHLAVTRPDVYAGVLAVSPSEGLLPETWDPGPGSHPLFLVVGEDEHDGIQGSVRAAEALWRRSNLPVRVHRHNGGHHFPPDWVKVIGGGVDWILAGEK
jgi:predicted esterase